MSYRPMTLARAVLLLALWLQAVPLQTHPAANERLKLVDLTGDFDRIWNDTADIPDDRRPVAFEAEFAKVLPGFYDPRRVAPDVPADKYQAKVLKGLRNYPDRRADIETVSREFRAMFEPARESFEKAFGPMRGYPPIYIVNSLGEFDGGTRDLPEGTRLIFGADVIGWLHNGEPVQPFFHHELFHLLHVRHFKDCEQLWCNLWREGLATYVASKLNPDADDASLLLSFPRPIRPAVEEHKQEAICAVRQRLDSTQQTDFVPLFTAGGTPLSAELPPRFGYYIGYLVAADLGRKRTLRQLATLDQRQARLLVEHSLQRMATC